MLTRRNAIIEALFAPAIVSTPGLLMPIKAKPVNLLTISMIAREAILEMKNANTFLQRFENENYISNKSLRIRLPNHYTVK